MLRPMQEVGGGKVLEVMSATPELAAMTSAVEEIEQMVTPVMMNSRHVAYPSVVTFGSEVLKRRRITSPPLKEAGEAILPFLLSAQVVQDSICPQPFY